MTVVPRELLTIALGAAGTGGAGQTDGGAGGNTTITGSVSGLLATIRGAPPGLSGNNGGTGGSAYSIPGGMIALASGGLGAQSPAAAGSDGINCTLVSCEG